MASLLERLARRWRRPVVPDNPEHLLFFSRHGYWRPGDTVEVAGDWLDARTEQPLRAGTYVITRVDEACTPAPAFYGRLA